MHTRLGVPENSDGKAEGKAKFVWAFQSRNCRSQPKRARRGHGVGHVLSFLQFDATQLASGFPYYNVGSHGFVAHVVAFGGIERCHLSSSSRVYDSLEVQVIGNGTGEMQILGMGIIGKGILFGFHFQLRDGHALWEFLRGLQAPQPVLADSIAVVIVVTYNGRIVGIATSREVGNVFGIGIEQVVASFRSLRYECP